MITTAIVDAIPFGSGAFSFLLQPADEDDGAEISTYLANFHKGRRPDVIELGFIATRLEQLEDALFVLGRLGQIAYFRGNLRTKEFVDGPQDFGFLTDMNAIDGRLYTVGMWRQAYFRVAPGLWERMDHGVRDEGGSVHSVTGFRAITGLSHDDLYAVGLEGEIWHFAAGKWTNVVSPTSMVLEQATITESGTVFAAGQAGVIVTGRGNSWSLIEQMETDDEFSGLEYFNGALYLATEKSLFRSRSNFALEPVYLPGDPPVHLSRLRAANKVLCAIGSDVSFWTEDGETWHRFELNPPQHDVA